MFDKGIDAGVYFELDCIGNVRRLRGGARYGAGAPLPSDLGGYKYTAFGRTLAADAGTPAPVVDGGGFEQALRWQGRWIDEPTGLYDVRNRVWSPELGAFLSPDEFQFHGARGTLWSWPGQNPIRHRDPSGRKPGDLYESLDMSAFFALDDYTALSQQYGVEVGGGLYKLGDSYFYSSPHVGDSTSIANLQDLLLKEAAGLPPGTELVGFYHTHPRAKGARSEMLSSEDVGLCGDLGGTGYVGTPEGLFGKFDARSSLSLDPGSRLPPFILPFQPQPHHQPVLKQIFLQTLSSM